jgi:predicted O-linked N-acetylglucosamine transferase (SPINDLY family)
MSNLQQAVALHQAGRLAEAGALYRDILANDPGNFDALHLLGVIFFQAGDNQKAVDLIGQAISLRPSSPAPYLNIGLALKSLGRSGEALASYDKALSLKPDYPDAWNNRGAALQALQRLEDAVASYDKALAINPSFAEAWNNRGTVLRDLKRADEALSSYDRALAINPAFAAVWSNRGAMLQDLRRQDEALASYDKALALEPTYPDAWNNRGVVLKDIKRLDEALACFDRAIALQPNYVDAYVNRAPVLRDLKRVDAAADSLAKALALKPDYEFLTGYWLEAKMMACDWEGLSENLVKCAAGIRGGRKMATPFPLLALFDDPSLHRHAAEIYIAAKYPRSNTLGPMARHNPGEKLRIGYYSADFHNHATAYLIAETFEAHDPRRFELYGFSFGPDARDEMRQRLSHPFARFIDIRGMSDKEVARLSRELGIDIAVDLKGYTQDSRPGIFAERAAPLQVHYLGYPGTMGCDYMDYVIADAIVIPIGSEGSYVEKVLRLPYSYQCNDSHRKISSKPLTREGAGLPESGFVFCSFNNNYKIQPEPFESWMRVLKAVQGSVLWLLEDNPIAAANLRKQAARYGLEHRLVFAGRVPLEEHLARHRLADLFLDTWPYNAHTTASDALWAGLPLLTRSGKSFASRVAASLLQALDLPELITNSTAGYEALAIALARDPDKLAAIRKKLESNRATKPLFDGKRIARDLEAGYEAIFARYRAGLSPDNIEITP